MMKNIFMKRLFLSLISCLLVMASAYATVIQGGIDTNETCKPYFVVVDKYTKAPVSRAKVSVPSYGYTVYTDEKGRFELNTRIENSTILSVDKQSYKPYSITISRGAQTRPMKIEIEQAGQFDIKIDTNLCHLGDNNFSYMSANAGQFKGTAAGPVYNKSVFISQKSINQNHYIVFGSIIGVDTALARGMGQNLISTSFASPPSVYLNGKKIAEIQINGDNQKIKLPKSLIKFNQNNIITIKAGRNLMQTAYVDYDDFEFMNLSVQAF